MHNGKPTLMVRIGNGRAAVLADARAQLNVLLTETTTEGRLPAPAECRAKAA
jgi:inward rectifier potassium channel